jgi:hypothetical protein
MTSKFLAGCVAAVLSAGAVFAGGETPSNPDATVFFVGLDDGATVVSPVTLYFGVDGMGIAPAGVEWDNTGHHHLILNRPPYGSDSADDLSAPIPGDENHRHFGGGQTQVTLELPPGQHTLQLVFGDAFHVPHADPIMSEPITIMVE